MSYHSHIINKQIIEVEVSDKAITFDTQQKISQLHASKLVPMLDRMLDIHFGADDTHYQIDRLTIDLGQLALESIPEVFDKELAKVLTSIRGTSQVSVTKTMPTALADATEERTPLRVLAHYLDTGRLPWWSPTQKKSYVYEQWELLMQNPTAEFKTLLSQLYHHKVHLDRYLYTFSEEQLLRSAQLITRMSENELLHIKSSIADTVRKSNITIVSSSWKNTFLRTVFTPQSDQAIPTQQYYQDKTLQALRLIADSKQRRPQHQEIKKIRSFIQRYQRMRLDHRLWQEFFKQLDTVMHMNTVAAIPVHLRKQMLVSLEDLQDATKIAKSNLKTGLLQDAKQQDIIISELLTPLATLGTMIEKIAKQATPAADRLSITKLQSQFEDTDFITIDNAGLVLFRPFLQRFFDNLGLLEDKTFRDQMAKHKAVCGLQYLCNSEESELFEGQLPLPKILCGVPLTAPIPPIFLTEEEKEIANGLLNAVLKQGPHWKNLSIAGFRASYVCRQASFRTRDDHWLLQVQKETYDITLQKLPWSIQAVKLPWMERALMVDWL